MASPIMRYFRHEHLTDGSAKAVSAECAMLAQRMESDLPEGPEKSAGLRKLLEAKDCFVRAALPDETPPGA